MLKHLAEEIANILENCKFDDIIDSSGYYVLREFDDETERCVDVSKSSGDETAEPHYVIYVSYENGDGDWEYTNTLSVDELADKLEELCE